MITLLLTLQATLRGVSEALRTVARLHINQLTQATQANRWFHSFWSVSFRILLSTIIIVPSGWWILVWQFSLLKVVHGLDIISGCNTWFCPTRSSLLLLLHIIIININWSRPGNQRSRMFRLWTEIITPEI